MYPMPLFKYPYTDYSILNLDWVVERIQEMYSIMDQKINEAIAPINTQITAINADLTSIHGNISDIEDDMNRVQGDISALYNNITVINDRISGVEGNVNTLTTDVEDIEIDINFMRNEIGVHTEEIADIYDKIADIDPDTGLIVDATNFNVEDRTASVLDPVYDFHLTGSLGAEQFVLYPDLIPGTQSGYYPRVTMVYDSNVILHLPSELTPAGQGVTLPAIIRGTYAINVDKNGDLYSGDPLEYSINGEVFTIDGYDDNAIILMCIDCLHRGVDEYENVYTNNGIEVVHGVPYTGVIGDYESFIGPISHKNPLPYGLEAYVYFFDIDGALLGKRTLPRDDNPTSIPVGTYSIWYGIGTNSTHEAWTNTTFHIMRDTMAGSYKVSNNDFVTEHKVRFAYHSGESWNISNQTAVKVGGIYGLGPDEQINMFTGDIKIGSTIIPSRKFNLISNGFKNLTPDIKYNVELMRGERYTDADLKYNKIMALINGLDANNTSY